MASSIHGIAPPGPLDQRDTDVPPPRPRPDGNAVPAPGGRALARLLARAARALGRGEDEDALAAALDAWRTTRDEALADAIDALSDRFGARLDEMWRAAPGPAERHGVWLAAAAGGRPADVAGLLNRLFDDPTRARIVERLGALAKLPPDPRIARHLAIQMADPGTRANEAWRPFWKLALDIVRTTRDPRVSRWRAEITLRLRAQGGRWLDVDAVSSTFDAIPDEQETGGPREPSLRTFVASVLGSRRKPPVALGFEQVYARPDDDDARLVLADLLQETGDPRGELIALQLGGKRSAKRVRELLREHLGAWLGPLAAVVLPQTVVFERGFLSTCAVACNDERVAEDVLGRPEWATVRRLSLYTRGAQSWEVGVYPLLSAKTMLSLREVACLRPHALPEIKAPLALTKLHVNLFGPWILPLLEGAAPFLPALEELDLGFFGGASAPFAEAVLTSPLVRQQRMLTVELLSENVKVEWLRAARRFASSTIAIRGADERSGWSWKLEDDVLSGNFTHRGRALRPWDQRLPPLRHAHAMIDAVGWLRRVHLTSDGAVTIDAETLAREVERLRRSCDELTVAIG